MKWTGNEGNQVSSHSGGYTSLLEYVTQVKSVCSQYYLQRKSVGYETYILLTFKMLVRNTSIPLYRKSY
jgi:hypothetical protein